MAVTTPIRRFVLSQMYPRVLDGLPVLGTPRELAADIATTAGDFDGHVDRLVRRHVALTGAAGFVSGLGGWMALPVALPANLAGVVFVQLHMVASIAVLAGHDPAQPGTRERVFRCLIGNGPAEPGRDADAETFDRVGLKLAERGLNLVISGVVSTAQWGAMKVAGRVQNRVFRGIPLVGGVIGAVSDGYITLQVARAAREEFQGGREHPALPAFPPQSGDGLPADVSTPSAPSAA